jgi:hypothetical protein
MGARGERRTGRLSGLSSLLAFRPWMLGAAVLLACALGIAVLEELRAARPLWAQVTPPEPRP